MPPTPSSIAGQVVSLHLNEVPREPLRSVDSATFEAGHGIEGDRHYTSKIDRQGYQVLLVAEETLKELGLAPGIVRENVTTTGIPLDSLGPGRRIFLGDQVLLQVSKPCAPCSRMDEVRQGLRQDLEGRRGMLASIIQGGLVRVGADVRLLPLETGPD